MKRIFLIIITIFLILAGAWFVRSRLLKGKQKAGIQIISQPKATIFLDGKHLGQTPFESKNLKPGEFNLKLVPESEDLPSWEEKIKLNPDVLTVVKHQFSQTPTSESTEILTLEPLANKNLVSLAIISSPDGAFVKVDGTTRGFTPISLEDITAGDHVILISSPGYLEKEIKARTLLGKKLVVNVKLAKKEEEESVATPSAQEKETIPQVEIKNTPTGWLRVRLGPTTAATEAAKVKPGEKYPLLDEKNGWYKIRYDQNKEGWISGRYATKIE